MQYTKACIRNFLWAKMDSNHRRYKPADLQSAPFGHSGIRPFAVQRYEVFFYFTIPQSYFFEMYCKPTSIQLIYNLLPPLKVSPLNSRPGCLYYNPSSPPCSETAFNAHIFRAVTALSLPLLPTHPPARSRACCIVSVVITPNITGGRWIEMPPTRG